MRKAIYCSSVCNGKRWKQSKCWFDNLHYAQNYKKKKKEKIYTTVEWSSGGKSRVEIFGYGMYHSLKKGMAVLVFEKLKGKDKKKFKNKKWLPIE